MEKTFADVQLDVEVRGEIMLAHLIFTNSTSDKIYLDTKTICTSGKTRRNIFKIMSADNEKVKYTGMMEKRIVVPEDFIPLDSGDEIRTSVELNQVYKINKGSKYIIQYSVYHPSYLDEGPLNKLVSNSIEVIY
ncbi:hypothetical protein [Longitalea luteola]|uniref:hypothetical protein n=1 Tax=Longitalea luteola TaxID=2812563 RepID=UPI001A9798F5|nr:hypothetical protein [Longitalea luteola]